MRRNLIFKIASLIFIFFIAFFIRSFKIAELFPFTMDEEYQAFLVQRILQGVNIPWIGVNVADTGMYLGPFFTWFSVLPYWLWNGDPMGTAWFVALVGAVTAVVFGIVVKNIASSTFLPPRAAVASIETLDHRPSLPNLGGELLLLLISLLYAVNPLINLYDRKFWNPTFVPLLTLIWLLCMWRLIVSQETRMRDKSNLGSENPKALPTLQKASRDAMFPFKRGIQYLHSSINWPLVGLALVFGVAFHTHYSLFVLLPPTLWVLFIFYKHTPAFSPAYGIFDLPLSRGDLKKIFVVILSILVFLICLAPIVAFDATHNWVQVKGVMNKFTTIGESENSELGKINTEIHGYSDNQTIVDKFFTLHDTLDRLVLVGWNRDISYDLTYCPLIEINPYIKGLGIIVLIALVWLALSKNKFQKLGQVILGVFLTAIVLSVLYPGRVSEYYFLPLIVLVIMTVGLFFLEMRQRLVETPWQGVSTVALIVILVMWISQTLSLKNDLGLYNKQALFSEVKKRVSNSPIRLQVLGDCFEHEGYRYLAEQQGLQVSESYMDPYFSWLYIDPVQEKTEYTIVISSDKSIKTEKTQNDWNKWQKRVMMGGEEVEVGELRSWIIPEKK